MVQLWITLMAHIGRVCRKMKEKVHQGQRHGKKDGGKFDGHQGGASGESRSKGAKVLQRQCWTCGEIGHRSSEC